MGEKHRISVFTGLMECIQVRVCRLNDDRVTYSCKDHYSSSVFRVIRRVWSSDYGVFFVVEIVIKVMYIDCESNTKIFAQLNNEVSASYNFAQLVGLC